MSEGAFSSAKWLRGRDDIIGRGRGFAGFSGIFGRRCGFSSLSLGESRQQSPEHPVRGCLLFRRSLIAFLFVPLLFAHRYASPIDSCTSCSVSCARLAARAPPLASTSFLMTPGRFSRITAMRLNIGAMAVTIASATQLLHSMQPMPAVRQSLRRLRPARFRWRRPYAGRRPGRYRDCRGRCGEYAQDR